MQPQRRGELAGLDEPRAHHSIERSVQLRVRQLAAEHRKLGLVRLQLGFRLGNVFLAWTAICRIESLCD